MNWRLSAKALARVWLREMRHQFHLIRKLERPTTAGDVAALHDLRAAIRRLRTLLRALEQPSAQPHPPPLSRRWQCLTQELSPLRDMDVWRVLSQELPEVSPAFRQRILRQLDRESDERASLLTGQMWSRLKRDTRIFLAREAPAMLKAGSGLARTLERTWNTATAQVEKLARNRHLAQSDAAHNLRIACRRARYLAEFFATSATRKKTRHAWQIIAENYQAAQQALGRTHDTDTLLEFMRAHRLRPPAKVHAALLRRRNQGLARFRQTWKRAR